MSLFIGAGSVTAEGKFGCGEVSGKPFFSVSKISTGLYQIVLSNPLPIEPVVMLTGIYYGSSDSASDNTFTVEIQPAGSGGISTFNVKSMDLILSGDNTAQYVPQDAPFYFTVFQSNT